MKLMFGELRNSGSGTNAVDSAGLDEYDLDQANNVIPIAGGYASLPFPSSASAAALSARCQGAFSALAATQIEDFAGDATKLYRMTSTAAGWADVSKGGGYDTAATDFWEFAQFGNKVIATNNAEAVGSGGDPPQVWTLGVSAAFADLGGSPPHAKHIAVIRDFVVLGHTYDTTDLEQPTRVRWSAFANEASWPTDRATRAMTQSDWQDMKLGAGPVKRIIGGASGLVFQQNSVSRMTYVGPPEIFRFDEVRGADGVFSTQSVVEAEGSVYYYSKSAFHRIGFDGDYKNISAGKVDSLIESYMEPGEKTQFVIGAYDPNLKCIFWLIGGSSAAGASAAIIYNPIFDRWALATLNETSSNYSFVYQSPIHSAAGLGTSQRRAWFFNATNHNSYKLDSATTYTTQVDTRSVELAADRVSLVQLVRPIMKHSDSSQPFTTRTLSIRSYNDRFAATPSSTAQTISTTNGYWQGRQSGRYHKFRLELKATAPFTIAGLNIDRPNLSGRV